MKKPKIYLDSQIFVDIPFFDLPYNILNSEWVVIAGKNAKPYNFNINQN
jgi:hypothetical protein